MIGELTAEASFTRIEEEVRRYWRRNGVPEAFHAARRDGSPYIICQQPAMAAGGSSVDRVRLLATTDLLARYRTMQGSAVECWTGWACHGLPVELAVERSLGPDLANYDLAQFNAACRQMAIDGLEQGEALAQRLGAWLGPGGTMLSLEPQAVGAVWSALRQLWEVGRLRHEHRIAPVCPRCATPLSSAEASRRGVDVETRSASVQMPWDDEPGAYFLTWTPVPWTLVGMVALAAHPEAEYVLVQLPARDSAPPERLVLAEPALNRMLSGEFRLLRRLSGRALRGAHYYPPFTFLPAGEGTGRVVLSDEVPLDRGTGLWPVTPAFDALSLTLAQSHGLSIPKLLDDWGGLADTVTTWRGLSPLDVEPLLVEELKDRGLLFEERLGERPQALCPYCESPLLPLASHVWLVETGSGPWVVSRDRAWGVPLPIWVCETCGDEVCVSGLDDLARRAGLDADQIDPHRPVVDRLTFPCKTCGGIMRRVAPVVDAAFESAVLARPIISHGETANLAIGLGDRHLGWLGDLSELAALLLGALAWERAVTLSEADPGSAWNMERMPPADAMRWAAYTGATADLAEQTFLRPLWRLVVSSLSVPDRAWKGQMDEDDLLDRWLAARLSQSIILMTDSLDAGEPYLAAEELAALVADLDKWYAPHRPQGVGQVLELLCRLLAPFVPHLAEAIHRQLGGRGTPSLQLSAWPSPDPALGDRELLAKMSRVRRLAELGRNARAQADVQPSRLLSRAVIGLLGDHSGDLDDLQPFAELIAKVLGTRQVQFASDAAAQVEWRLSLLPEHRVERDVRAADIEAALADLDAEESARLASQLWAGLSIGLQVSGWAITLLPDEVYISAHAQPGWAAAADAEHLAILNVG